MSTTVDVHPDIRLHETHWVLLCAFLKENGYELRARYQPDWVPSWTKIKYPTPLTWKYEDGERSIRKLVDATRVSDGMRVMLKLAYEGADNSEAHAHYLAEHSRDADPRNHCLPLLDVLRPPQYPGRIILVSPYCLPWNIWPFVRVSEAVEFFSQILEGLAFLHSNRIAHLDASEGNIVMDGTHLYQEPFHPMRPKTVPDGARPARHLERYQSKQPIKYFFIDFEWTVHFDPAIERPLFLRTLRQDKTVPEECAPDAGPCDPFALDVYCIGHMIVEHWLEAYKNVEFIRKLAEDMVAEDPTQRPSAEEAARRFQTIRESLTADDLEQNLVQIPEYHSFELRARQQLDAYRQWKKSKKQAAAAAKRAARKEARAGRNSAVLQRLGGLLSHLFVHRDKAVEDLPIPTVASRDPHA